MKVQGLETFKCFSLKCKNGEGTQIVAKDFFEGCVGAKDWWQMHNPSQQAELGEIRSLNWEQDDFQFYFPPDPPPPPPPPVPVVGLYYDGTHGSIVCPDNVNATTTNYFWPTLNPDDATIRALGISVVKLAGTGTATINKSNGELTFANCVVGDTFKLIGVSGDGGFTVDQTITIQTV
jgi:hypothetical protein